MDRNSQWKEIKSQEQKATIDNKYINSRERDGLVSWNFTRKHIGNLCIVNHPFKSHVKHNGLCFCVHIIYLLNDLQLAYFAATVIAPPQFASNDR